jgi:multiple sugar transport system permease protein
MSYFDQFVQDGKIRGRYDSEEILGLLLIIPALLIILLTLVYPFLDAIRLSFYDIGTGTFVGIDNYQWLFGQDAFTGTVWRSFVWTVGNMALQGAAGIGIALLLNRAFFGRNAIRTIILIPFIVPTAVTAVMWRYLFNSSYGPINHYLVEFGLISEGVNPLAAGGLALATVILINTWRWAPLVALVVLAVLQTIPREEYEAARMEGASAIDQFRHVTFPHLQNSMLILGLLGFLLTFNIFDMVWLLTEGGPSNATLTLPVYIYEIAFNLQSFGRAGAASIALFGILVVFVFLYFQQEEFKEGDIA